MANRDTIANILRARDQLGAGWIETNSSLDLLTLADMATYSCIDLKVDGIGVAGGDTDYECPKYEWSNQLKMGIAFPLNARQPFIVRLFTVQGRGSVLSARKEMISEKTIVVKKGTSYVNPKVTFTSAEITIRTYRLIVRRFIANPDGSVRVFDDTFEIATRVKAEIGSYCGLQLTAQAGVCDQINGRSNDWYSGNSTVANVGKIIRVPAFFNYGLTNSIDLAAADQMKLNLLFEFNVPGADRTWQVGVPQGLMKNHYTFKPNATDADYANYNYPQYISATDNFFGNPLWLKSSADVTTIALAQVQEAESITQLNKPKYNRGKRDIMAHIAKFGAPPPTDLASYSPRASALKKASGKL